MSTEPDQVGFSRFAAARDAEAQAYIDDIPPESRSEPAVTFFPVPRNQIKQALPPTQLPCDMDAEKGVLSSIFLDPKKGLLLASHQLKVEHFYSPIHQTIFRAINQLRDENKPIDLVTITIELNKWNLLESGGGAVKPSYLAEIQTFLPTAEFIEHYIQIVRDKAAARQLWQLGKKLQDEALTPQEDLSWIIEEARIGLKAINPTAGLGALPSLDDMSTLMGMNIPPAPPELVKGILHQGSKLIIGGTSKGRKTFSLMDLAVSVATGTPWWGCETIKGKVCYINFEIQRPFFCKRHDDICSSLGVRPEKGMLMCWTLRGLVEGIEKMSGEIVKVLMEGDYSLIVFDPIYKALGDRDENKAGDVASLLNELEAIAVKTGAAIAFGAHYSKGNQAAKEAIDRIGGSGVFARDPDAILTMTPHALEECFTVEATLRNFPPQPPFVVRWDWPIFTRDEAQDPADLKKPKDPRSKGSGEASGDTVANTAKEIIKQMEDNPTSRNAAEMQRFMRDEAGVSSATFYRAWKIVKTHHAVRKLIDGRWIHENHIGK